MALLVRLLPLLVAGPLLLVAQPTISPPGGALPDARTNTAYSFVFGASGGAAPYAYTITSGTLPTGFTLSTTGVLSGSTGSAFSGAFTVQVRDNSGATAQQAYTLRVLTPLSIVTVGFQSTPFGVLFNQCLSAQGGTLIDGASNGTWSIVNGSLPPGVTLVNQAAQCGPVGNRSAALGGTPTQDGIYTFTLQVTDTAGQTAQRQFTLTILSAGPLQISPAQLAFTCQIGGVCSNGAAGLNINSGGGQLTGITVSVNSTGGNWLQIVGLNTNTTPAAVQVFVDPSVITVAGTYTGSITIRANATAAVTVPVTLTAVGQTTLTVTASQLNFTVPGPGTAPPPQTFTISSSGPSEVPVAVNVTGGFPYVVVTQSSERTPTVVTVRINITGLPLGITNGNIQITANATNSPINIPVTIVANTTSLLTTFPNQLAFNYATGNPAPQAQGINVSSASPGLEFTTSTTPNTPWLVVANAPLQTPGQVVIAVNPVGLSPGTRTGNVILTPITGGQVIIPVTFTITTAVSNLVLSPPQLNFNFQIGGGAPQEQTVAINTSNADAPLAYTAAINASTGASWLRLSGTTGTTPGFISVGLNTLNLVEGVYNASIVISANGAGNNPQTVPVTLTVARQFAFSASPNSLSFTIPTGSGPQSQAVQISTLGGNQGYVTASSSSWLTVSPTSGTAPTTLGISVNPQGLGPGTYQGTIQVSATVTAAGTLTIPVSMTITANSQLRVTPGALQFAGNEGVTVPGQGLLITSSTTPIPFSATTSQPWIGLSTTGGTTPGNPTVTVLPAGLAPGVYRGEIRLTTTEPGNSPIVVPITYTVTAAARIPSIRAITNGASLLPTPLAPLMIFTVFGENLGPANLAVAEFDPQTGRLPRSLAGVRLLVDGVAVPLLYVSNAQLSGIAPSGIGNRPTVSVQAEVDGTLGLSQSAGISQSAPALFTTNASGSGQAAALNEDGGLNSPLSPAAPGSIVVLYLTGTGELNPRGIEGGRAGAEAVPYALVNPLTVEIDGQSAEVLFAGQAPGQLFGLTQVNLRVPATARRGALPVVVRSGSGGIPTGVTIEVQP